MLQPQIVHKPALKIIGVEAAFRHALSPVKNNFEVIPPLWDRLCQQTHLIPNRVGEASFGIIYGKPPAERSHPDELQYIAGVEVSATEDVPPGMVARTIPAGTFAAFIHRGPIEKIGETCFEIYRVWLPQSGYQHAGIADVERYDHRFDCNRADSEMDYWISVVEKSPA